MAGHRRRRDAERVLAEQAEASRALYDERITEAAEKGKHRDFMSAALQYARAAVARAEKTHPVEAQQAAVQVADMVASVGDQLYKLMLRERWSAR